MFHSTEDERTVPRKSRGWLEPRVLPVEHRWESQRGYGGPLWMGQRNPAPPKGWCFNPINNGMCTIYQLMIGISQRSKVSRLTVGFLVYIYIYMSIQFDVFFLIATYNFWVTILCRRHIFAGRGVLVLESHDGAP